MTLLLPLSSPVIQASDIKVATTPQIFFTYKLSGPMLTHVGHVAPQLPHIQLTLITQQGGNEKNCVTT